LLIEASIGYDRLLKIAFFRCFASLNMTGAFRHSDPRFIGGKNLMRCFASLNMTRAHPRHSEPQGEESRCFAIAQHDKDVILSRKAKNLRDVSLSLNMTRASFWAARRRI